MADVVRLQQVFTNLLTNAAKFTPAGGRCSIVMTADHSTATVTVSDTGCGISEEALPHVFEAYRQDTNALTHSTRGLGLGLSICQHLVCRHGGSIAAFSEGAGRGATFTVAIPLLDPRINLPAVPPALAHSPSAVH